MKNFPWFSLVIVAVVATAGFFLYKMAPAPSLSANEADLEEMVLPEGGIVLPIKWGDLGVRMVESGVIDKEKFVDIYSSRGGLSRNELMLLEGKNVGNITMTLENSGYVLNLLWAFGLGNKNEVLEKGPMMDSKYGGAGNFASTGGWTLAKGNAMDHYSKYSFVVLNSQQQAMVERVSKNIYRPCCNNSVYFPDCNHGMAMLGLLELLAKAGVSESDMYTIALQVNSYWFPQTYLTIAKYFETQRVDWSKVNAKEILGFDFSSASGYQNVLKKVSPSGAPLGGSCGA